MDAIRKKMHSMKVETDQLREIADRYEHQAKEVNQAADKNDLIIRDLGKKIGSLETRLEEVVEGLQVATVNLEKKSKQLDEVEDDVNTAARKVTLLEVESREAETRMGEVVMELANKCRDADGLKKKVRYLEAKNMTNEMTIEDQERDLREANRIVYDSERKLDEIQRRLGITEDELKRALERADIAEGNLVRVEEELRTIGDNMMVLEVAEEKAVAREEKYIETIKLLTMKLKDAIAKAEYGEMNITKLNLRIDDIEDEIVREKLKIQKLGDELGDTFDEMLEKY